jgi:hypothetical protein
LACQNPVFSLRVYFGGAAGRNAKKGGNTCLKEGYSRHFQLSLFMA